MNAPVDMTVRHVTQADHHVAILKPKAAGAADIAEAASAPTVTVTEFGIARFIGDVPPGFPPNEIEGVVLDEVIKAGLPVEDAGGQTICTVRWLRKILVSNRKS